jgi:hypothetical protein
MGFAFDSITVGDLWKQSCPREVKDQGAIGIFLPFKALPTCVSLFAENAFIRIFVDAKTQETGGHPASRRKSWT